ncbi:uncharacterized protein MELLADRAFT_101173 [Melampsora larici-populina 98AG31]|uniref:F-box domain-containing protein n=1 Tax=Melampsora larici-populina (strain 98AG31 / pathotype 3-4-7) TaxID=747676 RepID=F4R3U9_MELLP|nr:uncharacterized protein MELLADRAFT_101173 [Melampsora larici-populina 98AG31]EGG12687.1 hypothetical protein MELLADRAFT_101173 [Melampsora larici-populina 98AG31]
MIGPSMGTPVPPPDVGGSGFGGTDMKKADTLLIPITSCLPLLESFECQSLATSGPSASGTVGLNLSRLTSLSRIKLVFSRLLDESWLSYSWPMNLVDLCIRGSEKMSQTLFMKIIQHIGPNVTKLGVGFAPALFDFNPIGRALPDFNPRDIIMNFPALRKLRLLTDQFSILPCFRNCKNIESIYYWGNIDWPVFSHLLYDSTWPKLKQIGLCFKADGSFGYSKEEVGLQEHTREREL